MKKALSLLITAAMLVAMLAVMAPAAFAAEAVQVGTADELIDVVTKINAGELAADTNITLTADIDLTGKAWKPLKVYNGTFDGNGKTITGAAIKPVVANNGNQKLDGGADNKGYVIAEYPGASDGNFGEVGFALLAVKAENATFKSFTLKDSTVDSDISFNRNWQMHYGAVVAYMMSSTISDVKLVNVDVKIDPEASDNQPFLGLGGIMVGVNFGNSTIENCSIDGDSSVDASNNAKYDLGAFVGRHSKGGTLTVKNSTNAGAVTACTTANRDGFHDAQKNDSSAIGCWAAVAVGRINNDVDGVVTLDVTNTGAITGAHVNGNTKIMVGDNQAGDTKVRFKHTAPGGLVGSVVEPQAKIWVTEGDKFYAPKDGIFLADKQLDEGKIELKLHRRVERTSQCSGIIFCVTDADNDCNFWALGDTICYFVFLDEGGALRFAIDGGYQEEGVYTGQTGWYEFVGAGDQVNLINAGYDVVAGVTLGVEFDNAGNVQVYVNGDLIYDVDIPENMRLPGTGFGFRMISESDNSTYTSSITAKEKCYHEETELVGAKDATETEEGYTGDTVCKDCGEVFRKGESIPAKEPATEEQPPKTGDVVLTVSVLALAAATGTVLIARKRKIEE
ncbi:MAG: hypothetical protein IJW62_04260, partial [Clostridia bacterium]|nr:hypothetical protein [Clostridia bacterium]